MSSTAAQPRATVVITTHDRPEYATRAVSSALAQTLADVEVVVVDDGSTPPFTTSIDDPRLHVIRREQSGGMCAARNDGLARARGSWVTFLDDDDELVPQMIERALAAADVASLAPPIAVMSAMVIVRPDGTEIERSVPPTLHRGEHYLLEGPGDLRAKNSLLIPTDVARAIGGWDEQFEAFEGDDFGLRLNRAASIVGLDEPLYRLTQHGEPRLTRRSTAIPRDMERTLAKHHDLFRQHRSAHAHYMSTIGMYHLKAERWGTAVHWCLMGLLRDPRRVRRWLYFAAAVGGPYARRAYRRVWPKEVTVSPWSLTKRRVRKYGRRFANYPRAAVAAPLARVTRTVSGRGARSAAADGSRSALVLCVYRARNAAHVAALVGEASAHGWEVRLWSLDRADAGLAPHTIGVSSGSKFPLLNKLVDGQNLERFDWVVVADDDFVFDNGSINDLLAVADAAGLDLVQPAHTELSHRNNEITRRRPFAIVRRTTFVEIGPLFAVRRPWSAKVIPFPAEHTMGWGLELEWFDLSERGLRLGVVDAVAVRHLRPAGKGYSWREQLERLDTLLRARELTSVRDVQCTLGTWRPWQPAPPWPTGQYE